MPYLIATDAPSGARLTSGLVTSRNLDAIVRAAGVELTNFDGRPWPELRRALVPAIHRIAADPDHYDRYRPLEHMAPVEAVVRFLVALVHLLDMHDGTVRVSR